MGLEGTSHQGMLRFKLLSKVGRLRITIPLHCWLVLE